VWLLTEGFYLFGDVWKDGVIDISTKKGALDHGPLALEFVFNGIFHFGQNILAFVLLSMLSPVSYSVASLIKRVWVIIVAIIWFHNSTTRVQAFGIALTFFGLYLYDRTSMEDAAERRAKRDHFRSGAALLPTVKEPAEKAKNGYMAPGRVEADQSAYRFPGEKYSSSWLPPGTKQETTWEPRDSISKH
jgi:solute carrier family 35 protein E1